jgi:predicted Fe-S protein YdhL (DUF1289 family)
VHWVAASVVILLVDYLTGPFIQFPILFIVPVAIATAAQGVIVGSSVAVLLPLLRLSFFLRWDLPSSWFLESIDTAVDMVILIGFAALMHQTIRQGRQIRVLEGMLPICSFCKRIRDESGQWRQLEAFISQRSDASFSHTFCEECGRTHYPELAE